jgi:Histidine phosphatase superfamily (branch 1)
MTADELRKGQESFFTDSFPLPETVRLELLREQDFGSLELTPWASKQAFDAHDSRSDPGFKHKETVVAMKARADQFLDDYIVPMWALGIDAQEDYCMVVVSHGLFLSALWKALANRFEDQDISVAEEIASIPGARPSDHMPGWTNTGYLELVIGTGAPILPTDSIPIDHNSAENGGDGEVLSTMTLKIIEINGRDHLINLKRARGGIGSAPYDVKQKQIDGFFNKPQD